MKYVSLLDVSESVAAVLATYDFGQFVVILLLDSFVYRHVKRIAGRNDARCWQAENIGALGKVLNSNDAPTSIGEVADLRALSNEASFSQPLSELLKFVTLILRHSLICL